MTVLRLVVKPDHPSLIVAISEPLSGLIVHVLFDRLLQQLS